MSEQADNWLVDDTVESDKDRPHPWNVLVVDDEPDVHQVTRLALANIDFLGRPLNIISSYSGAERRHGAAPRLPVPGQHRPRTAPGIRPVRASRLPRRTILGAPRSPEHRQPTDAARRKPERAARLHAALPGFSA